MLLWKNGVEELQNRGSTCVIIVEGSNEDYAVQYDRI